MLINAISALLVLAILLIPDSPLRTVLGVPFVLFFPGYTLISALFPAKPELGGIERFSLSLGLSLAVIPLIGLGLNYTPWGIRLTPVVTSLFLFTLLMSTVTLYRRTKLPIEQQITFNIPIKIPSQAKLRKFDKLFIIGIIAALVLVASAASYLAVTPKIGDQFTEFYLLGEGGKLSDYPTNLTLGQSGNVTLGIINHEAQNVTYRIIVNLENQTLSTIDSIPVADGEGWNRTYTFTPDRIGNKMRLEFQLCKEELPEVYRSLQLWIDVQ